MANTWQVSVRFLASLPSLAISHENSQQTHSLAFPPLSLFIPLSYAISLRIAWVIPPI